MSEKDGKPYTVEEINSSDPNIDEKENRRRHGYKAGFNKGLKMSKEFWMEKAKLEDGQDATTGRPSEAMSLRRFLWEHSHPMAEVILREYDAKVKKDG